jgi:hypothetical protein
LRFDQSWTERPRQQATKGGRLKRLPIGYPMDKFGPVKRKPITEVACRDRWGNPRPR